ncbi:MAG: rane carboxypeptidase/penicillin-binding protein [Bacteroidetes bacterium]|jgi:penicillin-binding protein 1A|nr:rane carboxypeptidase/penicillin-binding protein [Bacteroidota bacterium]MDF2451270.1 rane carboxypeptidase/penicillin-binding protein [Bacteroidota bacterium]
MAAKKNSGFIRLTWLLVWLPFLILFILISFISLEVFVDLPSVQELQNPKSNLATVIYSSDMKTLGKYYAENRVSVKYYELDADLVNALIATEDARFHNHSGVDIRALGRAVFGAVTGSSSSGGGSTLSQQLAKMMFPRQKLSKPKMILQKLKEWVIAARLEKNYTKDEILALYLNKFDFLNQAVGVKSAAQIYFNRTQDSLEIQQAAMLIGMAKNPSLFNPIKKADTTLHRRNVVMKQMVVNGFLTKEKYDSLKKLPLGIIYHPEDHNDGLAPYFREYLREYFLKEWCSKHVNPETNKPYNIYRDGLRIYTTIDSRMQQYAEEAVLEHMTDLQKQFTKECKTKKNAPFAWNVNKEQIENIMISSMKRSDRYRSLKNAGFSKEQIIAEFKKPVPMTVYSLRGEIDTTMSPWDSIRYYKSYLHTGFMSIEPSTGYVKAWVGGVNHRHFKFDHVKVGRRQVGSTFKPFVYALAIQEGYSPCYQVANVRTCIETPGQPAWCPDNSDGNKGTGKMVTLRYALAGSINYVTAWVMKQFGPDAVINLVRRLGITAPIEAVPSIALGTPDISVFEMVAANATFANKGTYIQPTFITRIEDKNGKVLEEFFPTTDEVFSEEKAYAMIQLMRGVVDRGTGSRLRSRYNLRNEIAGKTGTTQNNADGWFMGLTPDLVAGCWVGGEERSVHFNSTNEGQGASMALPIWGKFFQKVYADPSLKVTKNGFVKPANMGDIELDCSVYDAQTEKDIPMEDLDFEDN